MKVAIVLVSLLGLVACSLARSTIYEDFEWKSYKLNFDKSYDNEDEESLRKQIFLNNKNAIDEHNERWLVGDEDYEMEVNEYTDMLNEEFELDESDDTDDSEDYEAEPTDYLNEIVDIRIPRHVNWTQLGAVSPVVDQGHFNHSWAFAAAGVVESRQFIKTGKMVVLSKQNLVDCSPKRNHLTLNALIYIKKRGIDTETSYPYRGIAGKCKFNRKHIGAKIKGIKRLLTRNETDLAVLVAQGPVAAHISFDAIKNYRRGVFKNARCSRNSNFAVLIVGYGHDKSAGDYWILKTPQGSHWGESGYIRLARGKQNLCGIANQIYFPTF